MKGLPPPGAAWHDRPRPCPSRKETALELLLPAMIGGPVGAAVVYALARRDLGHRRAVLAAGGSCAVIVAAAIYASLDTM